MRRFPALLTALCLALGLAGCGRPALSPEGDDAPGLYAAGAQAAAGGDYAAAIDAYSRAIEAEEDQAAAYAGRADCYLALAGLGEGEPSPDLRALARRDHETALALDPALGAHIYEVYTGLAEEAMAAGDDDRAMDCLVMARAAAPEKEEDLREQMKTLTGGMLPGSVWYLDGPDSRYYAFSGDGTGRITAAAPMGPAGGFSYENEGFALVITEDGESRRWTYDPEMASYYAASGDGEAPSLRLGRTTLRRMYGQWQADILAQEAQLRADRTADAEPWAGYDELCLREYALLEELSGAAGPLTEDDEAALAAAQERLTLLEEDAAGAREAFRQLRRTVSGLLLRLPETSAAVSGPALGEIFPIGEPALLDYLRLVTDWTLRARELTVPGGAEALTGWESLADVDHYFLDGRLYLRLSGYALQEGPEGRLVLDGHGRFSFATPLTFGDDVTASGVDLLVRLQAGDWLGLWDEGYDGGTERMDLRLAGDMTCSLSGGPYPGGTTGVQTGVYALEDRQLTLTLSAEGYSPGTYRYQVFPMGDSLYMTLLTDGIVYGQTAGSAWVFCGGAYAGGVRASEGEP